MICIEPLGEFRSIEGLELLHDGVQEGDALVERSVDADAGEGLEDEIEHKQPEQEVYRTTIDLVGDLSAIKAGPLMSPRAGSLMGSQALPGE